MTIPFDLDTFLRQPRLSGLALSPDGRRLVVGVATEAPDQRRYRTSLWLIDPDGRQPPRQLTRSAPGESGAAFAPDGTLLFLSARPDPDATADDEPPAALWALPAGGGEARLVLAPPGGVRGLEIARDTGDLVVHASLHPRADTFDADREQATARTDAGVTAQLFDDYPIRHWDAYLGPREPARWYLPAAAVADATGEDGPDPAAPRLLARGSTLHNAEGQLTPDGRTYVTTWRRAGESPSRRSPADLVTDLVAIDVHTGERRTLVADGRSWSAPRISHDGTRLVCQTTDLGAPDRAADSGLALVDLADGSVTPLADELDLWPTPVQWLPDDRAVLVETDDHGHRRVLRIEVADGTVTRLTAAGAHTDAVLADDGRHWYALRSDPGTAPQVVRHATDGADQTPTVLPSPAGDQPAVRLERLPATADDGTEVGSWLVLPEDRDEPAPLVVFIHGGPLGSWNSWSWRWCPAVLAAAGYAVLLPDPALSTGYGRDFVQRGWGRWSEAPYTDLLAAVDAAEAHTAVDGSRTAAMGGSFGGYMANWVAGHTDRFSAIVTHASLWNLEGFHGTTDMGLFWEREFGDPYATDRARYREHSPQRHVGNIRTPMLVIHGELDYRVPISEGLTLWTDLARHGVDARFLHFPDENHWILKPQNARLWYQTVLAFLDEHVHGTDFARPDLL
ncbi:S9 family peptidase [Egicoccus halophilus]|uniref:Peptidase S9 n=1 Tax=Egicoccus halophilus TaxID=1670830 RepID=A0A8J3A9D8_9ACTN|nr:S9 family peptidase [Egicoccus halophilus]GGI07490.1 peptidase S9 [Egicoccus halophilus]